MMPSGHKAFLVNNTRDVDLLLMHNKTFAAEYVARPKDGTAGLIWIQDLTRGIFKKENRNRCSCEGTRC
jgi:hypothetical protein